MFLSDLGVNVSVCLLIICQMPRKYVKREIRKWSEVQMKQAVADVMNNGWSVRHSANVHCVPRLTLWHHVIGSRCGKPSAKKLGQSPVLTAAQEDELVEVIKDMVRRLFGLSQMDVRRLVSSYCKMNHVANNFSEKHHSAGGDWFKAFLRRHPDLTIRKLSQLQFIVLLALMQQKPSSS